MRSERTDTSLAHWLRRAVWTAAVLVLNLPLGAQVEILAEVDKLTASNAEVKDAFSRSLSLDGDRLVVGADLADLLGDASGAAYIYEPDGSSRWLEVVALTPAGGTTGDYFGVSVSLDGDRLAVGAEGDDQATENAGAVYLFERQSNGDWTREAKLVSADGFAGGFFGHAVSLDGDRLSVGAPSRAGGAVYVFENRPTDGWMEVARILNPKGVQGEFGVSVALEAERILIGDYAGGLAGSAYIYERQPTGTWQLVAELVPGGARSGDLFGWSVDLAGDRALVGAWGDDEYGVDAGKAYVFENSELDSWDEVAALRTEVPAAADRFGYSVSISADSAVVGSYLGDAGAPEGGEVSLFRRTAEGLWEPALRTTASDSAPGDRFGFAVALDGDRFAVGALEDDDAALDAGAAYLFDTIEINPTLEVSGSCPGEILIEVSGVSPLGTLSLSGARAAGTFVLPGGPCRGVELDLANPKPLLSMPTGYERGVSISRVATAAQCAGLLQLLDERTCTLTTVQPMP